MNQLRPARVPSPQSCAADAAETALGRAFLRFFGFLVQHISTVNGDVLLAFNLERRVISSQIDCEAAAARGLSTYRAVTKIVRVWVGRADAETDTTTVT